jgi:hypothetical protein
MAGCTAAAHPRALAIAAAVAGPPTHAFDAVNTAHAGSFIAPFPIANTNARCVAS